MFVCNDRAKEENINIEDSFESYDNVAIKIRGACKYYGSENNKTDVLDNLDLTVPKGHIYALLGASGSGKTTLLSCVVGNRKLNSGTIQILGTTAGQKGAVCPGPRVGYMPQENALYQELTIWETMKYFGWIAGLNTTIISERLQVLVKLLLIPDLEQLVKHLSGGEQRRISFAVVLLYRPEILILDEPTVGLDPLLRESVWSYLLNLVKNKTFTIVLTTHYIEETRQAHMVGLMRKGYIIAEAAPERLLSEFRVDTLEDVFLKLSKLQNNCEEGNKERYVCHFKTDVSSDIYHDTIHEANSSSTMHKVKALIWKQFITMLRNIPLLIFTIMSAALSISLFFIGVGHDPNGISVAVINYETNNTICDSLHCTNTYLSCNYIESLKHKFYKLTYLPNKDEGDEMLRNGSIYAYLVVKRNYTPALKGRMMNVRTLNEWNFEQSTIDVYRDYTAITIAGYIKQIMTETFEDTVDSYLESCNITNKLMKVPINWKDPVYGEKHLEITYTSSPAYLLMVSFCVASIVTSCSLLIERNEGTYDRIFALGVSHIEILISHMVSDFCLILGQVVSSLFVAFIVFGLPLKGSLYLIVALTIANSVSGMCCGYAIASILQSESAAMHLLSGSMTPAILLSGTMWPKEGMHPILQEIAWFLPVTQTAHSVNSILYRKWDLSKPMIYLSFVNCISWIIVFLIITVVFLRYKQN